MRLDRFGTLLVSNGLQRTGLWRPRPGISVLMYHSVSEDRETGVHAYYGLVTSRARFREQLRCLRDAAYRVVDLAQALILVETDDVARSRLAVISFDDGYRDFITDAWPVLQEFGFSATVFLPTRFIGGRFNGRECLTWAEARELSREGVSFGSHTVSHRNLRGLPWSEITQELRASRRHIEDALGIAVTLFAHPYAFPREDPQFVADLRQELVESGYKVGATTLIGRLRKGDDPLSVKRLPVNDHDDNELLRCKLSGAYDWIGRAQAVSRVSRRVLGTLGNRGSSLRTTPRRPSDSGVG